jgi:acetolactate synthase regulatory subunit
MRFTLEVQMTNTEGVLERLLGRLRQRGFGVLALSADISMDKLSMGARITVESERPIESALKQLGKLYDVELVKVHHAEHEHANSKRQQQPTGELCLSL